MLRQRRCFPRCITLILLALFSWGAPLAFGQSQPIPPDIIAALKSLKHADADTRQSVYDLLGQKGDARLIPALQAYEDGELLLHNDELATYGPRVDVSGQGSMLPMIDAITGQPINGDDGKPILKAKIDLSEAMRAPPRRERTKIADLISTLSLLDPDPVARIGSIRDAGDRASRAFLDADTHQREIELLNDCKTALAAPGAAQTAGAAPTAAAIAAINQALGQKQTTLLGSVPDETSAEAVQTALDAVRQNLPAIGPDTESASPLAASVNDAYLGTSNYLGALQEQQKSLDELSKYSDALHKQLTANPSDQFTPALTEACAEMDLVLGDRPAQLAAIKILGGVGTSRAANILNKYLVAAQGLGDAELVGAASDAVSRAQRYQTEVSVVEDTFAGLSDGSILVLLALGLSIVFGLMGVINMAHGEFMMVGAFTTFVVAEAFKRWMPPGAYSYYLIAAVPAAFIVAGIFGLISENLVIRHLYGRPLETLLATWGIGLILIQLARSIFGDNESIAPPKWMEGGVEVAPDLFFPLNRVYIIVYCFICITFVYFIVNKTKLGLLLRATTQNRPMASSLGVGTRRIDAITFALGAGLAGLAGVAVPLYNKINPSIGQEYIVDSFMVVVVGGVGKLSGAIIAGLALGFISKYVEPLLSAVKSLESSSSVLAKVIVLALVVLFLQYRPAGLFPPKGRTADA